MASGNTNLDTFYAYGKENAAVEAVMRLHAVKRWHMLDTTRQQTLAEHSANVAMLAFIIAIQAPEMFFGPADNIASRALMHDLDEVFSGDIPTPTKNYGDIRATIKTLEKKLVPQLFQFYAPFPEGDLLIKICDLADGIRFIRLHGVDITSRHAKEGLESQLMDRFQDTRAWPDNVGQHVRRTVNFYAYENS